MDRINAIGSLNYRMDPDDKERCEMNIDVFLVSCDLALSTRCAILRGHCHFQWRAKSIYNLYDK
ncbi:unnamed protein product [Callosobruchus maculatus]|uniref:Uncharacterized protein n=1 Tax=Callosobruchus maculatus TaxID=64391 RepID=A0A653D0F5_CALMS|nr:unnamed protein product [Callosobruchus maculatus]